jgi:hypothetical protein
VAAWELLSSSSSSSAEINILVTWAGKSKAMREMKAMGDMRTMFKIS